MRNFIIMKSAVFFFTIAICFTVTDNLMANSFSPNDEGEKIEAMANKLAKKLLLTPDQTSRVTAILTEYFKNVASVSGDNSALESSRKASSKKITELLDAKQKMKFEIIEADWWKEAND